MFLSICILFYHSKGIYQNAEIKHKQTNAYYKKYVQKHEQNILGFLALLISE